MNEKYWKYDGLNIKTPELKSQKIRLYFIPHILRKTIEIKELKFFWLYNIWENNFLTKYFCIGLPITICNSAQCKIKFTGQWYSTTTNVPNIFTDSSKAIKFAYIFLLQTWPGDCLFSNSDHKKVFTPIYKSLHILNRHFFQQKCADMAYSI